MTAAIRVTVDNQVQVISYNQITGQDVADFNAALGRAAAFSTAVNDPSSHDLDVVAGFMWLALRKSSPKLGFAQVAAAISYDALCVVELIPDLEGEVNDG